MENRTSVYSRDYTVSHEWLRVHSREKQVAMECLSEKYIEHVLFIVTFSHHVCFITYTNLRASRPFIDISAQLQFIKSRK